MKITNALPCHAPYIAKAIMMAVGEAAIREFAGQEERVPLVEEVFRTLAAQENTQYSYLNTLVAVTEEGELAGVCIAYDGALLHPLRERFFAAARKILGKEYDCGNFADETSPDEIYLDTLAVFPPYRGQGLGLRLIEATAKRHSASGKPLGLLVDPDNEVGKRLYARAGFHFVGMRPFAGTLMNHLQRQTTK